MCYSSLYLRHSTGLLQQHSMLVYLVPYLVQATALVVGYSTTGPVCHCAPAAVTYTYRSSRYLDTTRSGLWCCGVAVWDPRSQYYQPFCLSVPSYVSYTPSYIPMARPLSLYRPVYGQEHVRYHMLWLYKDTTGVRSVGSLNR